MDALICDISAFLYWRTPPVVRLLTSAREDDPLLLSLFNPERVRNCRRAPAASSALLGAWAGSSLTRAHYGAAGVALMSAAPLFAGSLDLPVDLLVEEPSQRRASRLARPRVWGAPVPEGAVVDLGRGMGVVAPIVALHQLAGRASPVRTVLLASELCGSFAVYEPPGPVRALLQELVDERRLPRLSGWSPALDARGQISRVWSRPPLLSVERLAEWASSSEVVRGRERLAGAARLVVPAAASPFEVQTGVLMGFSPRRGGEGYDGFVHNRRIELPSAAARIARRSSCVCDLYWEGGEGRRALDLECRSSLSHLGESSAISDADRSAALQLMGIEVVELTYGQLADPARFEAFSGLVAEKLGVPPRERTAAQRLRQARLREEVLVDWERLPFV